MAEEITTPATDATQQPAEAVEAKPAEVGTQEPVQTTEQVPVENSNEATEPEQTDTKQEGEEVLPPPATEEGKPSYDELKAKLDEYQVREEEDRAFKERLGLKDIDQETYNLMNLDQQIVNDGKQSYLQLCNEYGIDSDPNRIDASLEKLRDTDPKKAYEFQRLFENLSNNISGKRQMVQQQATAYEVNKFSNDYGKVLEASPALNNVITQYVSMYGDGTQNMYGQLQSVMDILVPVYQEAFNAGKKSGMTNTAKKDTTPVQGGIATANSATYSNGSLFTREQIGRMSPEEFAKNEKAITQQILEGKL